MIGTFRSSTRNTAKVSSFVEPISSLSSFWDHVNRIIDVIERVQTRRNTDEKKAADRFTQAQDGQHSKRKLHRGRASNGKKRQRIHMSTPSSTGSVSSEDAPKVTLRRRQPSIVAPTMDLSWKNGGRLYPKQTSQIGDEFQVVDIPAAGTFSEGAHSDLYELIYDPSNNNAAVVNDTISSIVPRNKKEQAFAKLGEMTMQPGYDASSLDVHDVIEQLKASDGSDWTTEEKATFHKEIFRLRKDLTTLSKLMGKDLNTCFTYYLSNFKRSEDYRILKVIRVDERMDDDGPTGSGVDSCAVCGDGGRLIICDGCEGEYHMECLRPRLRTVPEGRWECDECVDKKLLKARDVILSMTKLYAVHQNSDNGETYSYEKPNGGNAGTGDRTFSSGAVSRPTSSVLTAVKAFATGIHALFDVPALPAVCEMDTDTPIKIEDSQPPVEEIS